VIGAGADAAAARTAIGAASQTAVDTAQGSADAGYNAAQDAKQRVNHTGTQSADTLTDGTTNKAFLATERTKLSGIATAATANDTDANLKARANHTGTQTASTISDFSTAADARVTAGITGKEGTITAGTTSQYWRGDKSWQTLDKTAVGLGNVDNTSDATKNAASASLTSKTIDGTNNTVTSVSGMLLPVVACTWGAETYTISGGNVTQIAGTTIDSWVTPAIGDRILVMHAPASSGPGTNYARTNTAPNGVYVVTGNTTNLTVQRATDCSGTVNPAGLSVYVEGGQNWNQSYFVVDSPTGLSAFTWGTTTSRWLQMIGSSPNFPGTVFANHYVMTGGTNTVALYAGTNGASQTFTTPDTVTSDKLVSRTSTDTLTNKLFGSGANPPLTVYVAPVINSTVSLSATIYNTYYYLLGAGAVPTLPTAVANGAVYKIKNIDTTNKTIFTTSSQTIDGTTTITLTPGASVELVSDGSNWRIF
jgi:hypothetical protein